MIHLALSMLMLVPSLPGHRPQDPPRESPSEIDGFMEKVLEKREQSWEDLQTFTFREEEALSIEGFEAAALESFQNEWLWIYRDGKLVRTLVKTNGVDIEDAPRKEWKNREGPLKRENFFGFEFEPGNYLLARREEFEGRELVQIEYYPEKLFDDDDEEEEDNEYAEAFKKTTLVRMWILEEQHQIVKMTFENVGLEFLPFRWLVRIDDLHASLIMSQPVGELWLPREIRAAGEVATAAGRLSIEYRRSFFDYQETDVEVRLKYASEPEDPNR